MVLDNISNIVMDISVMIVYANLVKRVACNIIERYHIEELTQYGVSICDYGAYVLK